MIFKKTIGAEVEDSLFSWLREWSFALVQYAGRAHTQGERTPLGINLVPVPFSDYAKIYTAYMNFRL